MKEMYTFHEHMNYLQRYKYIFCGAMLYIVTITMLFGYYFAFHVDGDPIGKYSICATIGLLNMTYSFLCSLMLVFYVTIQNKFLILNEFIR